MVSFGASCGGLDLGLHLGGFFKGFFSFRRGSLGV